jgi:hypothetical protein
MRIQNIFLIASLIALISFSCGKAIEEVNPNFIGFWQGSDESKAYTIRIDENGKGKYSFVGGGKMGNSEGRFRYRNGKLRIGGMKTLTLEDEPSFDGDFWTMKVEGIIYRRNN